MSGLAETIPNPPARHRTREARTQVLPVAEVFSVLTAERNGMEVIAAVIVGDERNPPKRHGLRATRSRWVQLFSALADEDEALREMFLATLGRRPAEPAKSEEPVLPVRLAPLAQGQTAEPVWKPGGKIL